MRQSGTAATSGARKGLQSSIIGEFSTAQQAPKPRHVPTAGAVKPLHQIRRLSPNLEQSSDETLLARVKVHDRDAFEELMRRHQARICNFATRVLRDPAAANDVVQETFLAVYVRANTFIGGRRVRPWLFKIAYNKCLDHIRQAGVVSSVEFDLDSGQSPEESADRRQVGETLRAAVGGLREQEREAILLRHQADLPYERIAEIMKVPIGTVKTHLFRARHRLRGQLCGLQARL